MSIYQDSFKNKQPKEQTQPNDKDENSNRKQIPISLSIPPSIHPIGIFNKDDADKSFYLGREHQISKLVNILTNSPKHSSTLVTGHRGAGKTSFVYECIRRSKCLSIIRYIQEPRSIRIWTYFMTLLATALLAIIIFKLASNVVYISDSYLLPIWLLSLNGSFGMIWLANRKKAIFNVNDEENVTNEENTTDKQNVTNKDIVTDEDKLSLATLRSKICCKIDNLLQLIHKILTIPVLKTCLLILIVGGIWLYFFGNKNNLEPQSLNIIVTTGIYALSVTTYLIYRQYHLTFLKQFSAHQPLSNDLVKKARENFFYGFLRFWTPTLVVHINLGFNDISHKAVINALVTGLRHEYKSTFLSILRLRFWIFLMVPIVISLHVAENGENWYGERIMKSKEHKAFQINYNERAIKQINKLALIDKFKLNPNANETIKNQLIKEVETLCKALGYSTTFKAKKTNDNNQTYQNHLVPHKDSKNLSNQNDSNICFNKHEITTVKQFNKILEEAATNQESIRLNAINTGFYDYKDFLGKRALLLKAIENAGLNEQQESKFFSHNKDHDNKLFNDFLMLEIDFLNDTEHKTWPPEGKEPDESAHYEILRDNQYAHRTMAYPTFFIISFTLFYSLLFSLSPYTRVYRRICELNDRFNASVQSESGTMIKPKTTLFGGILSMLNLKHTRTFSPMDSKSVEILFTNLLKEMSEFRFFNIFLPKPKLIFVLDELDKLGSKLDLQTSKNDPAHRDSLNPGVTKREANVEHLLAEMKNILSSGAASFICIGGRELQDKWLADQTERMPLLTSVFDRCIYIPNMLVTQKSVINNDTSLTKVSRPVGNMLYAVLSGSIKKWNKLHRVSSTHLRSTMDLQTINHDIYKELRKFEEDLESSVAEEIRSLLEDFREHSINLNNRLKYSILDKSFRIKLTQLIRFLSYRSLGNPKKFHELIASYISTEKERPHLHVLRISDESLMNIQLLSGVFSLLEHTFGRDMHMRDDKVLTAIFYLADFMFKFHKRAFSWDSLEKIDELADIHRAPDIHQVLKVIVKSFEDIFLHPVFNGLYSFKFRHEIANEIKFISKASESAMASFNFTLDESLPLRTLYVERLKMSAQENGRGDPDIIASLGELYEFDELYDSARKEYHRAIHQIDMNILPQTGDSTDTSAINIMNNVLTCPDLYYPMISSWIFARLKLMMQIGMTYEQSGNLDRAFYTYSEAKAFADLAINAFFFTKNRGHFGAKDFLFNEPPLASESLDKSKLPSKVKNNFGQKQKFNFDSNYDFPRIESENILEHFDLLFQPLFAKAWVQEKMVMAIHSSGDYLAKVLDSYTHILGKDTVSHKNVTDEQQASISEDKTVTRYLGAELRNRAGDLLFFKGKSESENDNYNTHLSEAKKQYKQALEITLSKISKAHDKKEKGVGDKFYKSCYSLPRFNSALIIKNALDYAESEMALSSIEDIFDRNLLQDNVKYWPDKVSEQDNINEKDFIAANIISTKESDNKECDNKECDNNQSNLNGFEIYLTHAHLAISMLVKAGYRETAASETIQVTHLLLHLIMFAEIAAPITSKTDQSARSKNAKHLIRLAGKQIRLTWEITPYLDKTHKARRSVSRYFFDLIRESCCYLMLSESYLDNFLLSKEKNTDYHNVKAKLAEYAVQIGYSKAKLQTADYVDFLNYVIDFNRYPVLFRLQTVTMTLVSQLLNEDFSKLNEKEFESTTRAFENTIEELEQWQRSYDSPILFSSANVGVVQHLFLRKFDAKITKEKDRRRLKRKIQDNIQQTISTYSMGANYYTMIEDMYYLYDDFNDRKMHFQFALLMLSDDLFKDILKEINKTPDK